MRLRRIAFRANLSKRLPNSKNGYFMTTQVLIKKLNQEIARLKRDVSAIKRVILSSNIDPEGDYRQSFIKRVLEREREETSYRFTTKENFLKQIHEGKK